MAKIKGFLVTMKHNRGADNHPEMYDTYDEAVQAVHDFAMSYDFEYKNGKLYDAGNDDGKNGGFDCISDAVYHNGKIAGFTHCDGDGPVAFIDEL